MLSWDSNASLVKYAIYAIPNASKNDPNAFQTSANLLGISYTKSFDISKHIQKLTTHQFAVAILDRYGNEYTPTFITTDLDSRIIQRLRIEVKNEQLNLFFDGKAIVKVFNIHGILLNEQQAVDCFTTNLARGIYIVTVNDEKVKIAL